jgi:hypothetical protein
MTIDFMSRLREKQEKQDLEAREAAALAELSERQHEFHTDGRFDPWHAKFDEDPAYGVKCEFPKWKK